MSFIKRLYFSPKLVTNYWAPDEVCIYNTKIHSSSLNPRVTIHSIWIDEEILEMNHLCTFNWSLAITGKASTRQGLVD